MELFESLPGQEKEPAKLANCKTNIPNEKDLSKILENPEGAPTDILGELKNDNIVNCTYGGVEFHHVPNMIKLTYSGILAQNNPGDIYAQIGYGDNDQWEDTAQYLMHKTGANKFELLTFRKKEGNVNIAFNDGKNNWDNNSGSNYVFYDNSTQGSH